MQLCCWEPPAITIIKRPQCTYSLLSVKMLSMPSASLSLCAFNWKGRKEEKWKEWTGILIIFAIRNLSTFVLSKISPLNHIFDFTFWSRRCQKSYHSANNMLYLQCCSRWSFPPSLCWCWACPPAGKSIVNHSILFNSTFFKYKWCFVWSKSNYDQPFTII